jgi:hypothetical protein
VLPPEKLVCPICGPHLRHVTLDPAWQATLCRTVSPNQGKKRLSADLITLNSASQTFVKFAAILSALRRLSKTFFIFFARVAYSQLKSIYPNRSGCQKVFQTIFEPPQRRDSQRTNADNTLGENLRKSILNLFFCYCEGLEPGCIGAKEGEGKQGDATEQFRQDKEVGFGGWIGLCLSH